MTVAFVVAFVVAVGVAVWLCGCGCGCGCGGFHLISGGLAFQTVDLHSLRKTAS